MTQPSPASLLRRAANAMRHRARHATAGPWEAEPVWSGSPAGTSGVSSYAHPAGSMASEVVTASPQRTIRTGGIHHPSDAVYIASWHPAVARAVAELLDEAAIEHETYDCRHCSDIPSHRLPCPALTLAHAYLGTHPTEQS